MSLNGAERLEQAFNFACFSHLFVEYVGSLSTVSDSIFSQTGRSNLYGCKMAGPSMLPTLANDGEVVVIDKLSTRLNPYNIQRGELLILLSPLDPQRTICKRVAGLPGDIICVDPTGEAAPSTEHVKIPKGHVWIMGDNAEASRDSRTYGPAPIGLIQGKLRARVRLPFSTGFSRPADAE